MSFPQFAFNNVKRNARAYFAYFLSSAFMVMMFFTYAVFIFHPDISHSDIGQTTQTGMQIAEYVIYVFSFLFVLYSISSFLKARNKEFGILTILGASSGQINWLVFIENMIIAATSILTGIVSGMLLSKLFLLLSAKMVGMTYLSFYWPLKAIILTVGAFAGLFLLISIVTVLFIRKNHVLTLLQGTSKPKKEPRVSIFFSVLGIVLLGIGLFELRSKDYGNDTIMIAAVSGIAGTYFFYTQLTVLFIRLLKMSRKYVWNGTRLIWIPEMAYKIKDNARMLFMVTVVTSIACMCVGFVLATDQRNNERYRDNPFAFRYVVFDGDEGLKDKDQDLLEVNRVLDQADIQYKTVSVETTMTSFQGKDRFYVQLISLTNYNHVIEDVGGKPLESLEPDQAIAVIPPNESIDKNPWVQDSAITVRSSQTKLRLTQLHRDKVADVLSVSKLIVVSDATYTKIKQLANQDEGNWTDMYVYYMIPSWSSIHPPAQNDPEMVISKQLEDMFKKRQLNGETSNWFVSRGQEYAGMKQMTSIFSFIGVFVAAIFSLSSASFLYFKLHTELTQDQRMYRSISKIGLSASEMSKSATIQIGILFFVPIVVSAIQTLVVLKSAAEAFALGDVTIPVLMAACAFLVAQVIYFMIVRTRYVHKLKRVMV